MSSLNEKPVHHYPRILEAGLNLTEVRKVHLVVAFFFTCQVMCIRESCMGENRTCSLSGGRRLARKRASSDPTIQKQVSKKPVEWWKHRLPRNGSSQWRVSSSGRPEPPLAQNDWEPPGTRPAWLSP